MAKEKTVFFCSECGYESSKWMGQCPGCKQWNTMVEEKVIPSKNGGAKGKKAFASPANMSEMITTDEERLVTGIGELDRVLGGGIVSGSLSLVGGDPGIGKSTLLLQVCKSMADHGKKVLYVSGEESAHQIKLRAQRLDAANPNIMLLCETDMDGIREALLKTKPDLAVIDSIQTMYSSDITSAAGSVSQVRDVTAQMMRIAKEENIAVFIVGHVTKEGVVAGPRTLEHMVDTVLYFEGESEASYRILRGVKNRFGSTNEIGVFEMTDRGLLEVKNPSRFLLTERPEGASGSAVVCSMEGTRPLLSEIQALVSRTSFQIPRRTTAGIDYNRVNLLMAVLEKRAGLHLGQCDAYVNLAGGMRLGEPAVDLGIVMAVASSYKNKPLPNDMIIFGEVGLVGEIRSVSHSDKRIKEAEKLGFASCMVPKANADAMKISTKINIIGVSNVKEALDYIR